MFEKALYEELQTFQFNGDIIPVFFGVADSTVSQPYITMFSIDGNGDKYVLCDDQFDSGDMLMQFNVYTNSTKTSLGIHRELDKLLTSKRMLTDGSVSYIINRTIHSSSPSAQTLTNGLAVDVLAKTFIYEKVK